jgi:hypothetical protein
VHGAGQCLRSEGKEQCRPENNGRVAQREPEAYPKRGLSLADQLAGGVVDDGDVVGVERVPYPEQKGGNAQADPVYASAAQGEVLGSNSQDQYAPAGHIEQDDKAGDACEMEFVPAVPATTCWLVRLRHRQHVAHSP